MGDFFGSNEGKAGYNVRHNGLAQRTMGLGKLLDRGPFLAHRTFQFRSNFLDRVELFSTKKNAPASEKF